MARPFNLRAQRRSPEGDLQKRVAAMLRAYLPDGVWWTCSLSGIKLSPGIANQAKAAGMNKGAPDLSFVWPDGETLYIELKADDGRLTSEQAELAVILGRRFAVCRTWPEVQGTLSPWLAMHGLRWLTDRESLQRHTPRSAAAFDPQEPHA